MDLASLSQQFRGRKFGELVLHHVRKTNLADTVNALAGAISELPFEATAEAESWLDEIAPMGASEAFWQRDCSDVFEEICYRARQRLTALDIHGTSDDVFNLFQIAVLNFAYGLHRQPQSKAFVQRAIGMGFLRRLISP